MTVQKPFPYNVLEADQDNIQVSINLLTEHGIIELYERTVPQLFAGLTSEGRKQLRELERKFPGMQASEDPGTAGGGYVGPPIPDDIAQKMSDKSWLRAMDKYKGNIQHKHFLKGGASEQGAVLSRLTKESPDRCVELAMSAPLDIDEAYCSDRLEQSTQF